MLHQDSPSQVAATTLTGTTLTAPTQVLLGTAVVHVEDSKGNLQRVRALVDNCSKKNIISKACVSRLGLTSKSSVSSVSGVNGMPVGVSSGVVEFKIRSCVDPSFSTEVNASVLPKVTSRPPQQQVKSATWHHLQRLKLADPNYFKPADVDLLLGVVHYNHIVGGSRRDGAPGTPTAMSSRLGWILGGEAPVQLTINSNLTLCTLDDQVRRF